MTAEASGWRKRRREGQTLSIKRLRMGSAIHAGAGAGGDWGWSSQRGLGGARLTRLQSYFRTGTEESRRARSAGPLQTPPRTGHTHRHLRDRAGQPVARVRRAREAGRCPSEKAGVLTLCGQCCSAPHPEEPAGWFGLCESLELPGQDRVWGSPWTDGRNLWMEHA
jgi:hypothetical protein